MKIVRLPIVVSLLASFGFGSNSYAIGFGIWSAGQSLWSLAGGVIGVAAGATVQIDGTYPTAGKVVTNGSAIWLVVDPTLATFFDGQISLNFNPDFLEVSAYGWLGDWGADSSISVPAVTPGPFIPDGTLFTFQSANANLYTKVSIDNINGNITAYYSWGPSGYQPPSAIEHVNIFGAVLSVKSDISSLNEVFGLVGFSEADNFNHCIPPGADSIQLCGCQSVAESFSTLYASAVAFSILFAGRKFQRTCR